MEPQDSDSKTEQLPPSSAEEAIETPLSWAVAKVVERTNRTIDAHKQDFLAAGITPDQLNATKANIRQRALVEHEIREKEDPLRRIEEALAKAATTDEERRLVELTNYLLLDGNRKNLLKAAKDPRGNLQGNWHRGDWRGNLTWNAVIVIVSPNTDEHGNRLVPSRAFQERLLENLGVLERGEKEGQALNEFVTRHYPTHDQGRFSDDHAKSGPFKEKDPKTGQEWITRIPTDIDGVEVRVPFLVSPTTIEVSISPQALQKIQPPQPGQF